MKTWVLVATAVLVLSGCASSDGSDSADKRAGDKPTAAATTKAKPHKPKVTDKDRAAKYEAAMKAAIGNRAIKDGCRGDLSHWQCYYDGIKTKGDGWITIEMSTPGDTTESEAKDFSKSARLAWFNLLGEDHPKLRTIVTYVNGRDTGTTRRDQVPLLNR